MTKEQECIDRLIKLQGKDTDTEQVHILADRVLCDFLEQLGYTRIVEEYEEVEKWYS